mgnify:CR=1 FL=1
MRLSIAILIYFIIRIKLRINRDIFGVDNDLNSEIIFATQVSSSITDEYGFSEFWSWSAWFPFCLFFFCSVFCMNTPQIDELVTCLPPPPHTHTPPPYAVGSYLVTLLPFCYTLCNSPGPFSSSVPPPLFPVQFCSRGSLAGETPL